MLPNWTNVCQKSTLWSAAEKKYLFLSCVHIITKCKNVKPQLMALENGRISHSCYDLNQAVRISMAFLRSSQSVLHLTTHGTA